MFKFCSFKKFTKIVLFSLKIDKIFKLGPILQ